MSEETLQERQDNEIEALKAIFCDDLVDNRQAIAWKVWRPLDLMLTLHPLHSSSVAGSHCSVTLHIKCCENYPNKPPSLSLHKIQGLSNENGAKLLTELEELAMKSCGEVMIFELAQHVQNFLHAFNKPTLSFYDEMLERRNEMERLKLHDQQVKENEERQKMKDEIQKRQEILKGAGRQRLHRTSVSQPEAEGQGDAPELIYYADNAMSPAKKAPKNRAANIACTCSTKGIQILRVTQKNNKKIHVGKCLGHSTNGATTYLAIDADTGDFVVTRKWSLNPATDFQTRNRQMNLIEQDLKAMSRIKHPPLIPYIAMEIQQEVIKRTSVQCVYIFRDFVLGTSLKDLRTKLKAFGDSDGFEAVRLLRHVGIGVLSALSELHSVGVLHRDVRSENVFLNDSGAVKLVGAALDVRLAEILEGENFCERQTKTQDIFSAAQLLLSIVSTHEPTHEVPSQLPVAARDFFSRCLTEDEQLQWSAEQLLNHGFLKDAPAPPPSGKQHDDGYSGSEDEDKLLVQSFVQSLPSSGHSRLSAEFEVLKWLGKGAFGDVLKVKNKLDGGFYAIKRIKLNPENVQLNKKITREVKLLSRLNHENVVRYYNAWIETMSAVLDDTTETVSTDPSVVKEQKNQPKKPCPNSMEADLAKLAPGVKLEWSISEAPITKPDAESDSEEDDNDDDDDDEDEGWFKRLPVTTNLDETSSSIEFEVDTDNQSQTLPSEELPSDPRPPTEHIQQVLYIQMEFCEKNTLRHAIDNGLFMENYRVWKLFREIVEGLAHVHQKGMIHRDLKPVNIFLDSNDHVKIGDFGLATKAFTSLPVVEDKEKPQEEFGGSLTGQIGTALYVAPELLQAGNKVIYNQKVDLYSLGIILFEMCHAPLDTGMERMMVLTELRTREILMSERVERAIDPKALTVIRWLLNHDPSLRPTCAELLSSDTVPRTVASEALSPLLSHALSARGSRPYTRLITECLQQTMPPSVDYTYHTGLRTRPDLALNQIKDTVIQVFKSHGATEFSPPLLMPRARAWDQCPNAVKVMTAFGTVCHLPHDLRLPFARHVAYTEAKSLRRYTVGLVFREKHVDGFHPREIAECAFDIVTPRTGTLWSDAELLLVANKAASAVNLKVSVTLNHTEMLKTLLLCCGVSTDRHRDLYPILVDVRLVANKAASAVNLKVSVTLNHTEMLKTLLLCCGVSTDRHRDLYPILVDVRLGRITNLQLQTHLTSLCITNRDIANLLRMMEAEVN
ncbi:hypothetical protein JYU34_018470 [Plutella xylostella]|uniref:non-specific serine/threonine protein kinase n=1 Tax=Plutella xylostella TaxID=51655 RepID=A0ABQ7PXY9_PLUXY|nr:hypothetical protein JYU34_018470 [Plutella xylostella]